MSGKDAQRTAGDLAISPAQLRELIHEVCRANGAAWASAGRTVSLANDDLSALSRLVAAERMSGVELRSASGLTSSSVTDLADRLELAGMITRSRPSHDRRLVVLKPTAKGRRTVRRALAPLHAKLADLTHRYQPAELERFAQLMLEVTHALRAPEVNS